MLMTSVARCGGVQMKMKLGILSVLAGAAFGGAACDESGGIPSLITGAAQLTVQLTDKPFPFSEVKRVDVFVVRIDAKAVETAAGEAEDPSVMTGWTTLVTPGTLINLLELSNGKTTNLGVATLPAGTYRSFRMVIDTDQSSITLNNDTKPEVIWPAAGIIRIKIILDQPV